MIKTQLPSERLGKMSNTLNYKVFQNDGYCGKPSTISVPVAVVITLIFFLSTFQPFRVLRC